MGACRHSFVLIFGSYNRHHDYFRHNWHMPLNFPSLPATEFSAKML